MIQTGCIVSAGIAALSRKASGYGSIDALQPLTADLGLRENELAHVFCRNFSSFVVCSLRARQGNVAIYSVD